MSNAEDEDDDDDGIPDDEALIDIPTLSQLFPQLQFMTLSSFKLRPISTCVLRILTTIMTEQMTMRTMMMTMTECQMFLMI